MAWLQLLDPGPEALASPLLQHDVQREGEEDNGDVGEVSLSLEP